MSCIQIANYLLARDAGVKALIANRVYPIQAPQATDKAYIVTNEVSTVDHALVESPGKNYRDRVSLDIIAPTADEVLSISRAAMDCLDGVVNLSFLTFQDVSIRFAGVGISDSDDRSNEARRIVRQFHVWWKSKA